MSDERRKALEDARAHVEYCAAYHPGDLDHSWYCGCARALVAAEADVERLRVERDEAWRERDRTFADNHGAQKAMLAVMRERDEAKAELAAVREDIEHGRCCDGEDRLDCGHPRCCMSEVCEICVEIGERLALRDAPEAPTAATCTVCGRPPSEHVYMEANETHAFVPPAEAQGRCEVCGEAAVGCYDRRDWCGEHWPGPKPEAQGLTEATVGWLRTVAGGEAVLAALDEARRENDLRINAGLRDADTIDALNAKLAAFRKAAERALAHLAEGNAEKAKAVLQEVAE